jgi:hypothetical protein
MRASSSEISPLIFFTKFRRVAKEKKLPEKMAPGTASIYI